MAVPGSGQLRLRADIAQEVDGSATGTNVSLRTLSDSAGKAIPDAMSEFYGYSSATAPTVTTGGASSTNTTVYITGTVNSDGGATITERGFYFGTNSSSPTNNAKYTVSGTTGNFNTNRTGLSTNTTYYYWAYATNSQGTTYGARNQRATYPTLNYNTPSGPGTYGGYYGPELGTSYNPGVTGRMYGSNTFYHPYLGGISLGTFDSGTTTSAAATYRSWQYGVSPSGNRGDFHTRLQMNFNFSPGYKGSGPSGDGYMATHNAAYFVRGYAWQVTTSQGFAANPNYSNQHYGYVEGIDGNNTTAYQVAYWIFHPGYNADAISYSGSGQWNVYK